MGFGREDIENKKRKPFCKDFLFARCLAESNRSTRFCRPLPNRSVKTPCRCLKTSDRCSVKLEEVSSGVEPLYTVLQTVT